MKTLKLLSLTVLLGTFFLSSTTTLAQVDTTKTDSAVTYFVKTFDGAEFVGTLVSQNNKEMVLLVKGKGEISIPKYQIKEMKVIDAKQLTINGDYIPEEVFSTRYFLTTNGLPIKKRESYILWQLFGPEFHFGVADNFGIGVMTTWVGTPMVFSAKYSIKIKENVHLGLGTLFGTGSWVAPDFGFALPFGALTIGDRRSNINISGGFGTLFGADEDFTTSAMISVGGMTKISPKMSFIFDSFILPSAGGGILSPGIRIQNSDERAFQIGFLGIIADGDAVPAPIPMLGWFRKF